MQLSSPIRRRQSICQELSILYLRCHSGTTASVAPYTIFQFSIWDALSAAPTFSAASLTAFQFSIWDAATPDCGQKCAGHNPHFQFSIWDALFQNFGKTRAYFLDFQFSIWDARWRTEGPTGARSYRLSILYLRCWHVLAAGAMLYLIYKLSILYLRCVVGKYYRSFYYFRLPFQFSIWDA